MLQLILGRSGVGKTTFLRQKLAKLAVETDKRILLIVPEQSTFSNEKAILSLLSPKLAQRIEVYSLSRLAQEVLQRKGLLPSQRIDRGGQAMLMNQAICHLEGNLSLYRKAAKNILFTEKMLTTVTELKKCRISPELLRALSLEKKNGILPQKLEETALLMEGYESLLGAEFSDTLDDLDLFYSYLETEEYFQDAVVALDSFSGFTVQEMRVIEKILCQVDTLFVTLTADRLGENEGMDVFAAAKRTAERLLQAAGKNNVKAAAPLQLSEQHRFQNPELQEVANGFLNLQHLPYQERCQSISLTVCEDIYDECDAIAREIKRLLREEGYRCREIAVICRDSESFIPPMKWALQKYEIPVFEDSRQPVEYQPLMKMVGYAFDVVNNSFQTSDLLRYAKCGLTPLSTKAIAQLENYAVLWKISGSRWKNEFSLHPRGFQPELTEEDERALEELNQARKILMQPLLNFQRNVNDTDGRGIAQSIYQLLQETKVQGALRKMAKKLVEDGEPVLAEELGRIWDLLMDLLDQVASVLKEERVTPKRFAGLYQILLASQDIGNIPQGMDEVTVGNADRIRTDNPKAVFLAGANEGIFPQNPMESGVFTTNDRDAMNEMGLEISNTYQQQLSLEYYSLYSALTCMRQRLYVSYRKRDNGGGPLSPSILVSELQRLFPRLTVRESGKIDALERMEAKMPAFEWMASRWREDSVFPQTLKQYFSRDKEYRDRYQGVSAAAAHLPATFQDSEKAVELFGRDLYLTASKVENFYNCPFQYFCKFGMKVYPQTVAELNPMQTGTVIHFILENILREYGSYLSEMEDKELMRLIRRLLDEYLQENMGGEEEKPARFVYLFGRLAKTIFIVVRHLARELAQSEFQPVDFELRINNDSEVKPTVLTAPDGSRISVFGVVDRVDIMEKDGKSYLRVIDYKTGSKVFDMEEVFMGLNMQMLIYLFAIWRNGQKKYGEVIPSGVLYMPAFLPYVSMERGADPAKLDAEKDKALCMNGLVLNDPSVVTGMERDIKGVYIPVSVKKNEITGSLVNLEELGALEKQINSLLIDIAMTLHRGEISPKPYRKQKKDACTYCDYRAVCRYQDM